jgi:hypothetical protein
MKKSILILHWFPRILCILAIGFILLLGSDSFDPKLSFQEQMIGFLIHSIPGLILIAFLVIAWRWELIGGVIFMIIGIGLGPFIYMHNYQMNHSVWISIQILLIINFPFILTGFLFVLEYFLKKKHAQLVN